MVSLTGPQTERTVDLGFRFDTVAEYEMFHDALADMVNDYDLATPEQDLFDQIVKFLPDPTQV